LVKRMSNDKITVIKSPMVPTSTFDDSADYINRVAYYIRLSNGLIVSGPDDFPNENEIEKVEKESIAKDTEENLH